MNIYAIILISHYGSLENFTRGSKFAVTLKKKARTGAEDYDVKKPGGRVGRNLALILVGVEKMNAKLNRLSREGPFNVT